MKVAGQRVRQEKLLRSHFWMNWPPPRPRFDPSRSNPVQYRIPRKVEELSREFPSHKGQNSFMANHFSALKRARQTEKRTNVNRANASRLRSALRAFREALANGDKKTAASKFAETTSVIDKGVQKGSLHKNTAARYKSRLSARLAKLK
jgi:small subunit ribosomal protein S20